MALVAFTLGADRANVSGPAGSEYGRRSAWSAHVGPAAPAPLSVEEERDPSAALLARRFNPAMALPIRDVWPVEVRYAWHDGGDLLARVKKKAGAVREYVAVPSRALDRSDWSSLPHRTASGEPIAYYVDGPGDDGAAGSTKGAEGKAGGPALSRWRARWREIVMHEGEATVPGRTAYPPTQYAHVFWWNRARGLLALQYWFYYPFNEWVNRHEGDWEHIQIILGGPSSLDGSTAHAFTPVSHHYFFHDTWIAPTSVVRLAGPDAREDHPLVYVGGEGRMWGWGGSFSGASYPYPGVYRTGGSVLAAFGLVPDEEVRRPARFIAASDFRVIMLPEPGRLDPARQPELSWLKLPFHAGQPSVNTNPPGYKTFEWDRSPPQPAARPGWFGLASGPPLWTGDTHLRANTSAVAAADLPLGWTCTPASDPRGCPAAATSGPLAANAPPRSRKSHNH